MPIYFSVTNEAERRGLGVRWHVSGGRQNNNSRHLTGQYGSGTRGNTSRQAHNSDLNWSVKVSDGFYRDSYRNRTSLRNVGIGGFSLKLKVRSFFTNRQAVGKIGTIHTAHILQMEKVIAI